MGDILCEIAPDFVDHNFAIIKRSSSEIANLAEKLTEAWKRDLFPSLIGSYDEKYSEEALEMAIERLHKVIVKRAIREKELADKRDKLAREEKEVNQMLTRLLATKLTKQGKIMVVEVKAKLEMLRAKQRYIVCIDALRLLNCNLISSLYLLKSLRNRGEESCLHGGQRRVCGITER